MMIVGFRTVDYFGTFGNVLCTFGSSLSLGSSRVVQTENRPKRLQPLLVIEQWARLPTREPSSPCRRRAWLPAIL